MACERGDYERRPAHSKRLAGKTVPAPGDCFAICRFVPNPAKLAAVPAGGAFFPGHGLDVGAVQRGCRPEAVEHDADGAAIAARADDDPFPAGEIWASHRSECAHPDAGLWRQPRPLFGRLCWRSRRTESHCGAHLFGRRGKTFGAECLAGNPPAHQRLTNGCGPEAIAAVSQGAAAAPGHSESGCAPSRPTRQPAGAPARMVSCWHLQKQCQSFPFIVTSRS